VLQLQALSVVVVVVVEIALLHLHHWLGSSNRLLQHWSLLGYTLSAALTRTYTKKDKRFFYHGYNMHHKYFMKLQKTMSTS